MVPSSSVGEPLLCICIRLHFVSFRTPLARVCARAHSSFVFLLSQVSQFLCNSLCNCDFSSVSTSFLTKQEIHAVVHACVFLEKCDENTAFVCFSAVYVWSVTLVTAKKQKSLYIRAYARVRRCISCFFLLILFVVSICKCRWGCDLLHWWMKSDVLFLKKWRVVFHKMTCRFGRNDVLFEEL